MPEVEDKIEIIHTRMVQMPSFQQPPKTMNVKLWEAVGPWVHLAWVNGSLLFNPDCAGTCEVLSLLARFSSHIAEFKDSETRALDGVGEEGAGVMTWACLHCLYCDFQDRTIDLYTKANEW